MRDLSWLGRIATGESLLRARRMTTDAPRAPAVVNRKSLSRVRSAGRGMLLRKAQMVDEPLVHGLVR